MSTDRHAVLFNKMTTKRRIIVTSAGCLAGPLLIVFLGYLAICWMFNSLPFHPNPFDTLKFNQHDWLEDESCVDGSNRRGHMADDIVRHHLHFGMISSEITPLLGTPEHIYTHAELVQGLKTNGSDLASNLFKSRDLQADHIFDYYLGEELSMGAGVDRAWLYLYLDKQDRYTGYRLATP